MFTPLADIPLAVRRMASARHEAGHILVAVRVGEPITGAVLNPPDGLSGEVQFENLPDEYIDLNDRKGVQRVERRIITLYAGNVAELEFWDGLRELYNPWINSHRDDLKIIKQYSAIYSPKKRKLALDRCRGQAQAILADKGSLPSQKEIAQWLAEHRSIDRARINEILSRHGFS